MCTLKLGNHPSIKLINDQIDPEFKKEIVEIRNHNIRNNTSEVLFYQFDDDVLYKMWGNYNTPIHEVKDEVGCSKSVSQRVIGAHEGEYDENFIICRYYGLSVLNIRLASDLSKDYENRFNCIDQQHGFTYQYEKIHLMKNVDLEMFKLAHDKVIDENEILEDNPIRKELEMWIEKAESSKNKKMNWSQVLDNSDGSFELIKKAIKKALMVEMTFSRTAPITNKTQKINDNPFGWGDWQKVRNQLTKNEELYILTFTENGDTEWWSEKIKHNQFWSTDGINNTKRQHFASSIQPPAFKAKKGGEAKFLDSGESALGFFKLLLAFDWDEENCKLKYEPNINPQTMNLIKDGSMYGDVGTVLSRWDAINKLYIKKPEEVKDSIHTLRDAYFNYFQTIATSVGSANNSPAKAISSECKAVAESYAKQKTIDSGIKESAPLNIKDLRLTKYENSLWVVKNSIVLKEKFKKKNSWQLVELDYLKSFRDKFVRKGVKESEFLTNSAQKTLDGSGSGTAGRVSILTMWHTRLYNNLYKNYNDSKVTTTETLRNIHDELFKIAEDNASLNPNYAPTPDLAYYFCPIKKKWLYRKDTHIGHTTQKKDGTAANMENTFIQCAKINMRDNNADFAEPKKSYQNIVDTYRHAMKNQKDMSLMGAYASSAQVLEELIKLYDVEKHLNL